MLSLASHTPAAAAQKQQRPDGDGDAAGGSAFYLKQSLDRLNNALTITLHLNNPAGRVAGRLAALLRFTDRAMLKFSGTDCTLKALVSLLLTNKFLNQHGTALSFCPTRRHPSPLQPSFCSLSSTSIAIWTRPLGMNEANVKPKDAKAVYDMSKSARHHRNFEASLSCEDTQYSLADMILRDLLNPELKCVMVVAEVSS